MNDDSSLFIPADRNLIPAATNVELTEEVPSIPHLHSHYLGTTLLRRYLPVLFRHYQLEACVGTFRW